MLYAAKCYWPGITRAELEQATARTSGARSNALASEVNYLGALLFSNDDLVLCLFDAPSRTAVKLASEQAGIPCERVMDSVWLVPDRSTLEELRELRKPRAEGENS
jgi:Nickel responsive protein SCO4226-like